MAVCGSDSSAHYSFSVLTLDDVCAVAWLDFGMASLQLELGTVHCYEVSLQVPGGDSLVDMVCLVYFRMAL